MAGSEAGLRIAVTVHERGRHRIWMKGPDRMPGDRASFPLGRWKLKVHCHRNSLILVSHSRGAVQSLPQSLIPYLGTSAVKPSMRPTLTLTNEIIKRYKTALKRKGPSRIRKAALMAKRKVAF